MATTIKTSFDNLETCKKDFLVKINTLKKELDKINSKHPLLDKLESQIDEAIKEAKNNYK
jgi:chaperonin cofactor prefoldin